MQKNREMLRVEDTNMALVGSDLEKNIKKAAAELEPSWQGAGKKPGLEVWRIENFQVAPVAKESFGTFYDGDSYILLHTQAADPNDPSTFSWEVHFWLGKYTSIDEACTAAYKTVELDDLLGGLPIQYRQVQGAEQHIFTELFPDGLKIKEGGVASGLKKVVPGTDADVTARLFHLKGTNMKNVKAVQVDCSASSLNEGDVFVLSAGKKIFVFQGSHCSPGERMKGSTFADGMANKRSCSKVVVVTTEDAPDQFWQFIGGKKEIANDGGQAGGAAATVKKLYSLSDAGGNGMKFEVVAEGSNVSEDKLGTNDVFILDTLHEVYVWVGKGASLGEKLEAMSRAQSYLNSQVGSGRSAATPILRLVEGVRHDGFAASCPASA